LVVDEALANDVGQCVRNPISELLDEYVLTSRKRD